MLEKANFSERTDPGLRSAIWQHDPARRRGVPYLAPAASRERLAVFRARPISAVAIPQIAMPKLPPVRPWSYRTPPRGHSQLPDWAP